jgi:hypothetical protein
MLIAALGHFYAFPYKEYAGANIGGSRGLTASLGHALKLNDFYHDTVHQVSITFYVLSIIYSMRLLAYGFAIGLMRNCYAAMHCFFKFLAFTCFFSTN